VTRTYVDAGVLIAGTRSGGARGSAALSALADPDRVFVCSAFVRLELLPKAIYHRQRDEVAFYEAFFDRVSAWAEPNARLVADAEQTATRYGLNALDALHVAAAILLGGEELLTTEEPRKPIHRVTELKVVTI
jgi:predicted nucleic acid-binding protein